MKKILVFMAIMIAVVVQANAQKVFGIDITTTCKRYCYQLAAKKGYKPYESVAGDKRFKVTYAGYKGTEMHVRYDQSNDSITEVAFYFPNRTKEEKSDIYNDLVRQFKQIDPNGSDSRMDIPLINTHNRMWAGKADMIFDEVSGKLFVSYKSKYERKGNTTKASPDI